MSFSVPFSFLAFLFMLSVVLLPFLSDLLHSLFSILPSFSPTYSIPFFIKVSEKCAEMLLDYCAKSRQMQVFELPIIAKKTNSTRSPPLHTGSLQLALLIFEMYLFFVLLDTLTSHILYYSCLHTYLVMYLAWLLNTSTKHCNYFYLSWICFCLPEVLPCLFTYHP